MHARVKTITIFRSQLDDRTFVAKIYSVSADVSHQAVYHHTQGRALYKFVFKMRYRYVIIYTYPIHAQISQLQVSANVN